MREITGNIISGDYRNMPLRSCQLRDVCTRERVTVVVDGHEYERAVRERVVWRNMGENSVVARFVIVNGVNYEVR